MRTDFLNLITEKDEPGFAHMTALNLSFEIVIQICVFSTCNQFRYCNNQDLPVAPGGPCGPVGPGGPTIDKPENIMIKYAHLL